MAEENNPLETLNELCMMLAGSVGPDLNAIERFCTKEAPIFETILARIYELQEMLEAVPEAENFGNPAEIVANVNAIYGRIDAIEKFVAEVKRKVQILEREYDRQHPTGLGKLLKQKDKNPPATADSIIFDSSDLLQLYGLIAAGDASSEPDAVSAE